MVISEVENLAYLYFPQGLNLKTIQNETLFRFVSTLNLCVRRLIHQTEIATAERCMPRNDDVHNLTLKIVPEAFYVAYMQGRQKFFEGSIHVGM